MQGTIGNYRISRTVQKPNHMIVYVEGVSTREAAGKLVGKAVTYTTEAGKAIKGKVAAAHGNSGAVRVIFERGMPGQAITKKVRLE